MPFTPSHAVVALAFVRTPLVPAAIAVGAMTPDLPLFVRAVVPSYATTHDPLWLPLTVLLALLLLLVWRCVLRPAVRELAPAFLAERLPEEWDRGPRATLRETVGMRDRGMSWRTAALLALSLAVGVLTHIVWDAFTHEGRWGVELLPALDAQWGPLTGLKWLQHASSAIGLVVLAVVGLMWITRRARRPIDRVFPATVRRGWWASLPLVLVIAWGAGYVALGPLTTEFTVAHLAYRVLPPACALWGFGTVALAVAVQVRRRQIRGNTARHARGAS